MPPKQFNMDSTNTITSSDMVLYRLADKLSALQYPYHFHEECTLQELTISFFPNQKNQQGKEVVGGGGKKKTSSSSTMTTTLSESNGLLWCQLRDVVCYLEDSFIRFLDAQDRPFRSSSSSKTVSQPVEFLSWFALQYLDPLFQAVNNKSNLDSDDADPIKVMFYEFTTKHMQKEYAKFADLLKSGKAAGTGMNTSWMHCTRAVKSTVLLVSVLCDIAIRLELEKEGDKETEKKPLEATETDKKKNNDKKKKKKKEVGKEDEQQWEGDGNISKLTVAHEQWQRDMPRRLVTSVESTPTMTKSTTTTSTTTTSTSSGLKKENNDQEGEKIREILAPIFTYRGVAPPASTEVAVHEAIQFIRAAHAVITAGEGDLGGKKSNRSPSSTTTITTAAAAVLFVNPDELLDTIPLFSGMITKTQGAAPAGKDVELEKATKVLRLLFTQDLRGLQDSINRHIGELQNYTSTCKTDPRLGRVGT